MQKTAPSLGRILTIAVFALSCFGLALFLWVSFGGTVPFRAKGYQFKVVLPHAGQLAVQGDVRISGVSVGRVVALKPTSGGDTIATIQLQQRYAPAHRDMRAILRTKTLLGETFVALTPGTRNAAAIPEGGTLGAAQVAPSVQLDEVYRTFNAQTRAALQTWIQSSAEGVKDNGAALNSALGELDPLSGDLAQVSATLASQSDAVSRLVRDTGVVFSALSQRQDQLRGFVANSQATFHATAAESAQLAAAFRALPTFESRSAAALRRLDRFAADSSPLLTQLAPSERALAPALQGLQHLSPGLRRLLVGLGPLTQASRRGLPALNQVLSQLAPLLAAASPVLRNLNPVLSFGDMYQPELEAFFANTAASTEATSPASEVTGNITPASIHLLRAFAGPNNLSSISTSPYRYGSNRSNAYAAPGIFNDLPTGLPSYQTSSCSNPVPSVSGSPTSNVSQQILFLTHALGISGPTIASPPCKPQTSPTATIFPQVTQATP